VWALLAGRIAGQRRMRLSRDRRTYPQRWEVPLASAPPRMPAAVRLYGADGTARCLAADLDVARAGIEQVQADAAALAGLVAGCGGRTITDRSPSGGRHVYVLLAEPVPFDQMRRVALALAVLLPALDATPMLNLSAGCIRPPGAVHKSGGVQQLMTPWPDAQEAAAAPNPPLVWAQLLDTLAPTLSALDADTGDDPAEPPTPKPEPAQNGQTGKVSTRMTAIARTGVHGYPSGSEARQAVLTAAAGAGWQLRDVTRHLETGAWPGLTSLYARYRPRNRRAQLGRDWRKATGYVARKRNVRNCHTSRPPSHRGRPTDRPAIGSGDEHRYVRAWRNAVAAVEADRYGESRAGLGKRMLLRSLAMAAHLTGNRQVEFGCRSLSLAAGMDPTTVARHLRELAAEPDPLIRLVEHHRGLRGDRYELAIPAAAEQTARNRAWPGGKAHGLRPAFRELGAPAALAYEVLERAQTRLTRWAVAANAGLSPAATAAALQTLAAYGLAVRDTAGWRRGPSSLQTVAEILGVDDILHHLQHRYTVERAQWRLTLTAWRLGFQGLRRFGFQGLRRLGDTADVHTAATDGAPGPSPPKADRT